MKIDTASVKVMRSHDYCHFEVCLTTTVGDGASDYQQLATVDNLRKQAARLADKAVAQYKVAKATAEWKESAAYSIDADKDKAARIRAIAEPERTPEQKAKLKSYDDSVFRLNRSYDYEDDWHNSDSN